MHEVLVNRLGGLSLHRKSVDRLTDRPDMTLDVYRGREQQYNNNNNNNNIPMSRRSMIVGQGPTALAVDAVGVVGTFCITFVYCFSFFSLSLGYGSI